MPPQYPPITNLLSLFVCRSSDGRSHTQRRHQTFDDKTTHINPVDCATFIVPRTLRDLPQHAYINPCSEVFVTELRAKLELLRRDRQMNHQLSQLYNPSHNSSRVPPIPSKNQINLHVVAELRKFQLDEDNDQSILDQHVSRIWSDLTPHRSPGTISPCPAVPNRRRPHDSIVTTGGDGKESDFLFFRSPFDWINYNCLFGFSWSINATFEVND